MRNSITQIVGYLKANPLRTESDIQKDVFNYDRKTTWRSNKKYADMLRRGLRKGIIKRFEMKLSGTRERYYYYVPWVGK